MLELAESKMTSGWEGPHSSLGNCWWLHEAWVDDECGASGKGDGEDSGSEDAEGSRALNARFREVR